MWINYFFNQLFSVQNLIAALTGSFIGFVWWLFSELRKKIANRIKYSKYEGYYQCYLKTDLSRHEFDISLKRKNGNKFKVNGKSISHNEIIIGFIEMSISIKNYGTGYYYHINNGEENSQRFGFYEIQLTNEDKIFVHQNIKGAGKEDSAAYVWKKVNYP